MNEGGMIKMYVKKENINEADVASALGVSEDGLHTVYESQTIEPDIKKKLEDYFGKNIFDGTMLTDLRTNVPDEQANKAKD